MIVLSKQKLWSVSFAILASVSASCWSGGGESTQPMGGLVRWSASSSGLAWKKVSESGESGKTGWREVWGIDGVAALANFRVNFDFRRRSPAPNVAEIARGFQVASSRAGYASNVSDRGMKDGSQWVEYVLPEQGEKGVKKIMAVDGGIITATLSTSVLPATRGLEEKSWSDMVDAVSALEFGVAHRSEKTGGSNEH